jgi:hypothetical protein
VVLLSNRQQENTTLVYERMAGMAFKGFGNGFSLGGIAPMERETINRVYQGTGINLGAGLGIRPDISVERMREQELDDEDWTMDFEGRGPEDH